MKRLVTLLAITILVIPFAPATAKTFMVGVCGKDDLRITIPVEAPLPGKVDNHPNCKKGCHGASERRRRAECTDDEGCC